LQHAETNKTISTGISDERFRPWLVGSFSFVPALHRPRYVWTLFLVVIFVWSNPKTVWCVGARVQIHNSPLLHT